MNLKNIFTSKAGLALLHVSLLLTAAQAQESNPEKIPLDKNNPFGSLAAGKSRIILIRDTNHKFDGIKKTVLENLLEFKEAGVKNILFEPYIMTPDEIDAFDDTIKNAIGHSAKIQAVEDLRAAWTMNLGENELPDYKTASLTQVRQSLLVNDILQRFYAEPSQAMADEVLGKYGLFSTQGKTGAVNNSGRIAASTIVLSKDSGMRVAYAGIDAGYDVLWETERYKAATAHEIAKMMLQPGITKEDIDKKLEEVGFKLKELGKKLTAARLSPQALDQEQDRILKYTNGKKSLVVWGDAHDECDNDLSEGLDKKLRAFPGGEIEPVRSVAIYETREAYQKRPAPSRGCVEDEPDMLYFVMEKEAELTASGAKIFYWRTPDPAPASQPTPEP